MANAQLEGAIIALYRNGNVVNISQATAQLTQDPQWRSKTIPSHPLISTADVRRIVFKLEKDGILKRESENGITRFRYVDPKTREVEARVKAAVKRSQFAQHHAFEAMKHLDLTMQALSSIEEPPRNESYKAFRNASTMIRETIRQLDAHTYAAEVLGFKLDRTPVPHEEERYNLKPLRRRKSSK